MIQILFFTFLLHRFSVNVLLSLCQQIENRSLAGIVIIGNGQSAHAIAMSGASMQVPVLWAKGGKTLLTELHPEVTNNQMCTEVQNYFNTTRICFLYFISHRTPFKPYYNHQHMRYSRQFEHCFYRFVEKLVINVTKFN